MLDPPSVFLGIESNGKLITEDIGDGKSGDFRDYYEEVSFDVRERPWYQVGKNYFLQTNKVDVAVPPIYTVQVGKLHGKATVAIVMPYVKDGKLVGVVA